MGAINELVQQVKSYVSFKAEKLKLTERIPFIGYDEATETFILEDRVNRAIVLKVNSQRPDNDVLLELYTHMPKGEGWVLQEFWDVNTNNLTIVIYKRYSKKNASELTKKDPAHEVNTLFYGLVERVNASLIKLSMNEVYLFVANLTQSEFAPHIEFETQLEEIVNYNLQALLAGHTLLDTTSGSLFNPITERHSFYFELGGLRTVPRFSDINHVDVTLPQDTCAWYVKTSSFEKELSIEGEQQFRSGFWIQSDNEDVVQRLYTKLATAFSEKHMTIIKMIDGHAGIYPLIGLLPANYKPHQDEGYFLRPIYSHHASELVFVFKEAE